MKGDFVYVDLETTGTRAVADRVTEVALIRVHDGKELRRWSSLVDPGCPVPSFITGLTGISDEMVREAPSFVDLADDLLEMLDGAVLVAHNARFDYGFLRAEFKRANRSFQARTLCTVRLARKLFPGHRSYALSALLERHDLNCAARHRAMGDIEAVLSFVELAERELGRDRVEQEVAALLCLPTLPAGLDSDLVASIPDSPGVYRFYGERRCLLYVGKSVRLRSRVLSHFSSQSATLTDARLARQVRDVEWTETAGELGALLLEARTVKTARPLYNRALKGSARALAVELVEDRDGYLGARLTDDWDPADSERYYGMFRSRKQAEARLDELCLEHELCRRRMRLEKLGPACFGHRLGRCRGACLGQESAQGHNARVRVAMTGLRHKAWPWKGPIGIREHNRAGRMSELHVVDRWRHLATVADEAQWYDNPVLPESRSPDRDVYRLLVQQLFSGAAGAKIEIVQL
ncbi:MAG TPA: DNA polymerase III subunit epsilon [Deltaproteobacteria bacterium]|nr:DNA polymerase III subunit epsilon [Candidatus Binatota bacterium]HIL12886.1 DNA polymerase III subunit epsilon [Deltaproteobacteria bacterium]